MTMAETTGIRQINILPELVKKAKETGSGIIIDGTTNLRSIVGVSDGLEPKLPDQHQDCIDKGGRVIIDWTGGVIRHPNNNTNGAKK